MSSKRIDAQWSYWIEDTLRAYPDEDVSWDLGLAALPDPATVGQFVGFMAIELMIPGTTTATVVSHRALLPPFAPEDQVRDQVTVLMTELMERRDNPEGRAVSPNLGVWTPRETDEVTE
jgi:hypothetical protein